MKSFEEFMHLILGILITIALCWGMIAGIKKFLNIPDKKETIYINDDLRKQKRRAEEIRRQQKQLMENQKQRLRDMQRR